MLTSAHPPDRARPPFTICTGMFGNGVLTPITKIIMVLRLMEVFGNLLEIINAICCAVVRGSTVLNAAARRIVAGTVHTAVIPL